MTGKPPAQSGVGLRVGPFLYARTSRPYLTIYRYVGVTLLPGLA